MLLNTITYINEKDTPIRRDSCRILVLYGAHPKGGLLNDRDRKLIWALMVTYFAHYFAFNLWHTTFNNFAVELFSVDGRQIGLIQSLREIPGFLGFTAAIISLFFQKLISRR